MTNNWRVPLNSFPILLAIFKGKPMTSDLPASYETGRSVINAWYVWLFLCLFTVGFGFPCHAQGTSSLHHVLFILDASGSMNQKWGQQTKFAVATEILSQLLDSLQASPAKVVFGLRVFGHQSARTLNNCQDSRLEVPFSPHSVTEIVNKLKQIKPKGQTPIAYSLQQALNDFPDPAAPNAMILITDGIETCQGNICDAAANVVRSGIALRPYIVGLGLNDSTTKAFACLGTLYDVQRHDQLRSTLEVIIRRIMNPTTCQVNLLDAYGLPSVTNVAITFYRHEDREARYQWIHTLQPGGTPDTVQLDPRVPYDLVIHSIPEVRLAHIELVQGRHNIIAADVPLGTLDVRSEGTTPSYYRCLIRNQPTRRILHVQDINTTQRYLAGTYQVEVLSVPRLIFDSIRIESGKTKTLRVPASGTLQLHAQAPVIASLLAGQGNQTKKVYDFGVVRSTQLSLLPGEYTLIYRPEKPRRAELTKQQVVRIHPARTTVLKL